MGEFIIDNFKFTKDTKLVFLDIDGVLNHQLYYKEMRQHERRNTSEVLYPEVGDGIPIMLSDIDSERVEFLNTLAEDVPNLYFIISSTWRQGRTIEELQNTFKLKGFKGNIIGKTPSFRLADWNYTPPRGMEIACWLTHYAKGFDREIKYVIFDDDSDMLLWQKDNYFWIDPYVGITPNIIYQAKRFLKGEGSR